MEPKISMALRRWQACCRAGATHAATRPSICRLRRAVALLSEMWVIAVWQSPAQAQTPDNMNWRSTEEDVLLRKADLRSEITADNMTRSSFDFRRDGVPADGGLLSLDPSEASFGLAKDGAGFRRFYHGNSSLFVQVSGSKLGQGTRGCEQPPCLFQAIRAGRVNRFSPRLVFYNHRASPLLEFYNDGGRFRQAQASIRYSLTSKTGLGESYRYLDYQLPENKNDLKQQIRYKLRGPTVVMRVSF